MRDQIHLPFIWQFILREQSIEGLRRAVANYTQPNFELGYALKLMRLMLLVLTAVFNLYGFVVGCILVLCFLVFNKTLSGRNYLNVKIN